MVKVTSPILPALTVAALASVTGSARAQLANTIQLTSSRDSLRADGFSRAVLTAEVRDGSGRIVPDGTEVRFSTTLGEIDPIAVTEAGRARANLTSPATPGFASIVVTAGQAIRELRVIFLSEGDDQPEHANVIPLQADYVVYSADSRILEGTGHAKVQVGSMTILADRVQIDVDRTRIVADSTPGGEGLTVKDKKTTWKARRFAYEAPMSQGVLEGDEGTFEFMGPPLTKGKAVTDPVPPETFQMVDLEELTTMWITAKRAALFPNQRIHLKGVQLRPDGKKVLSLPYQSIPLTSMGSDAQQLIGLGTQGLSLDVPYYVSLTDKTSTSLHLGWNQQQGSLGAVNPGMGLNLRHRIFTGERGEDTFDVNRFTSKDWGASYKHLRNWSPTMQTSAYVEFPDHRDLFATGNAYFQGKNYTGALSGSSSVPRGFGGTYSSDLSLATRPKHFGKSGLNYSLISSTGFTTGTLYKDFRQSLMVRTSLPSLRMGRRTVTSANLSVGQVLAGRTTGLSADAFVSANHQFGARTSLGMNYTYTQRPGYSPLQSKHRLSANFVTAGKRMSFYTSLTHALDGGTTSLINSLDYEISPRYRLGLRNYYFSYAHVPYSDQEFSLTTALINRPFTISWSRKRHRFVVEFAQLVF